MQERERERERAGVGGASRGSDRVAHLEPRKSMAENIGYCG